MDIRDVTAAQAIARTLAEKAFDAEFLGLDSAAALRAAALLANEEAAFKAASYENQKALKAV